MALDRAKLNFVLGNISALPVDVKKELEKDFQVRHLLFSTTIENKVSLSLDEARAFLENGEECLNMLNEETKKHFINQKNAYDFMLARVKDDTFFNDELIKRFHEIIMDGEYGAGEFRTVNISVNGSMYVPPRHEKINQKMEKMFTEMELKTDLIEKVAFAHAYLDKIHPFLDGNGRCSRLVLNYLLLKNNLLPITFDLEYKTEYFKALEKFKVEKDLNPLVELIQTLENIELEKYEKEIRKYM